LPVRREFVIDDIRIALGLWLMTLLIALLVLATSHLTACALTTLSPSLSRSGACSGGVPPHFKFAAVRRVPTMPVTMATVSEESDEHSKEYHNGFRSAVPVPFSEGHVPLSSTDMALLLSLSELSLVPCLGDLVLLLYPDLRDKAVLELQKMDAVLDPIIYDLMGANPAYSQRKFE
jgi:hypothetical protein